MDGISIALLVYMLPIIYGLIVFNSFIEEIDKDTDITLDPIICVLIYWVMYFIPLLNIIIMLLGLYRRINLWFINRKNN